MDTRHVMNEATRSEIKATLNRKTVECPHQKWGVISLTAHQSKL